MVPRMIADAKPVAAVTGHALWRVEDDAVYSLLGTTALVRVRRTASSTVGER
jgi:hypothetical protein